MEGHSLRLCILHSNTKSEQAINNKVKMSPRCLQRMKLGLRLAYVVLISQCGKWYSKPKAFNSCVLTLWQLTEALWTAAKALLCFIQQSGIHAALANLICRVWEWLFSTAQGGATQKN